MWPLMAARFLLMGALVLMPAGLAYAASHEAIQEGFPRGIYAVGPGGKLCRRLSWPTNRSAGFIPLALARG